MVRIRTTEPLRDGADELRSLARQGLMPVPHRVFHVSRDQSYCVVARHCPSGEGDLPETISLSRAMLWWPSLETHWQVEGTYAWESSERTLVVFGKLEKRWVPGRRHHSLRLGTSN